MAAEVIPKDWSLCVQLLGVTTLADYQPHRIAVRWREGTDAADSRRAGLTMTLKLALVGEGHWHKVTALHLVALVRAGVRYQDGGCASIVEEPEQQVGESREGIAA